MGLVRRRCLQFCIMGLFGISSLNSSSANTNKRIASSIQFEDQSSIAFLPEILVSCQYFLSPTVTINALSAPTAIQFLERRLHHFKNAGLKEDYDPNRESVEVFSTLKSKTLSTPLTPGSSDYDLANRQYQRLLYLRSLITEGTHNIVMATLNMNDSCEMNSVSSRKKIKTNMIVIAASFVAIQVTGPLVAYAMKTQNHPLEVGAFGVMLGSLAMSSIFTLKSLKSICALRESFKQLRYEGNFSNHPLEQLFRANLSGLPKDDLLHLGFSNHLNRANPVYSNTEITEALTLDHGEKTPFVQLVKDKILTQPLFTERLGFGYYSVDFFATGGTDNLSMLISIPKMRRKGSNKPSILINLLPSP